MYILDKRYVRNVLYYSILGIYYTIRGTACLLFSIAQAIEIYIFFHSQSDMKHA